MVALGAEIEQFLTEVQLTAVEKKRAEIKNLEKQLGQLPKFLNRGLLTSDEVVLHTEYLIANSYATDVWRASLTGSLPD